MGWQQNYGVLASTLPLCIGFCRLRTGVAIDKGAQTAVSSFIPVLECRGLWPLLLQYRSWGTMGLDRGLESCKSRPARGSGLSAASMPLLLMWLAVSSVSVLRACLRAWHAASESVPVCPGFDFGSVSPSPCNGYGATNICGSSDIAVAMQDLRCKGGELSVTDCSWSSPSAACSGHELDSVVYCGSRGSEVTEGSARLISSDGASSLSKEGTVEVFMDGKWSSVCGVTPGAASVLCRAMGYAGAASNSSRTAKGRSAPEIGELSCKGSEADVRDCSYEAGGDVYCAVSEAAFISCA